MITYNVRSRFFHLKDEAEIYRKSMGLEPRHTRKIYVRNRVELAKLLDALCDRKRDAPIGLTEAADSARSQDDIPGCVPKFLRADWGYPAD
ncbi:MAG: hypothetical protein AAF468_22665 [Pseudomonadota bacterium]